MAPMIGHLGTKVSALLDGRLSAAEEERAWEHVHSCQQCRDLVEHEGWVKTRLASLRPAECTVSHGFKSNLLAAAALGALPPEPEPTFLHRHRSVMVFGSSAAGVAFLGMAALGGVFSPGIGSADRRPPTQAGIDAPIAHLTASARPTAAASATGGSAAAVAGAQWGRAAWGSVREASSLRTVAVREQAD